jgi:CHASE2 domain-containing sensor protein
MEKNPITRRSATTEKHVPSRFRASLDAFFVQRWKHWLIVVALILLGEWISGVIEDYESFLSLRHHAFQVFQNIGPRRARSRDTRIVLIDDATYWHGPYEQRVPINRRLLAALVSKVATFNPAVIALDIDLSTGDETVTTTLDTDHGPITLHTPKGYADETLAFATAVKTSVSAADRHVVLTQDIDWDDEKRYWFLCANAYDGFDFGNAQVMTGYIQFDTDIRKIPPPLKMKDGNVVDSFSIAVAKAFEPGELHDESWSRDSFAGFMSPGQIPQVTATDLLKANSEGSLKSIQKLLGHKIVLIGGGWHRNGYLRGRKTIDSHRTPVGEVPGVFVHANYVESLLDGRVLEVGRTTFLELPVVALSAIVLSLRLSARNRLLVMLAVIFAPVALCYVGVQNFGIYFDVFLIDLLLVGHTVIDHVLGWYRDHVKYLRLVREGKT